MSLGSEFRRLHRKAVEEARQGPLGRDAEKMVNDKHNAIIKVRLERLQKPFQSLVDPTTRPELRKYMEETDRVMEKGFEEIHRSQLPRFYLISGVSKPTAVALADALVRIVDAAYGKPPSG